MYIPTPDIDASFCRKAYLVLPRNGHAAGVEFTVESVVGGVQIDTLHRRELLDVQHVLSVDSVGLQAELSSVNDPHREYKINQINPLSIKQQGWHASTILLMQLGLKSID